jgi:hypothetical protein
MITRRDGQFVCDGEGCAQPLWTNVTDLDGYEVALKFMRDEGWRVVRRGIKRAGRRFVLMSGPLFRLLYALLVVRHSWRELIWLGVTAHPSAEWIARQLTEACGWSEPPRYPFASL